MNNPPINPFNELYVTETIAPEEFVRLFSPFLIKHALALFQPGNIVVKGVQGSGKSMLLNLLRPEIRIAYKKQGLDLPIVPKKLDQFIGAGINLTRSVAHDFGQRIIEVDSSTDIVTLPLYFADFFNYWVVLDILNSIGKLSRECRGEIGLEMGLRTNNKCLDTFATNLAADPCWFGYLNEVKDYLSLTGKIVERIAAYRSFLNFNIDTLPDEIKRTKTTVGEPISKAIKSLWQTSVVSQSVSFFIRIDQYEELCRLEDRGFSFGLKFREIINKAIGMRDPNVSYRIGSRRYAWDNALGVYGTTSVLELERDYKEVDIDMILRRRENRRTWVFPGFAEDVFDRRLENADFEGSKKALLKVLGNGLTPDEKARRYASTSPEKLVLGEGWQAGIRKLFTEIAMENPLSAKLGEAWIRQRKNAGSASLLHAKPWEKNVWWKKERIQQALMQIASLCRQRMLWAGRDEVLALSGGNILVFVSLCQHIWAAWIQSVRGNKDITMDSNSVPSIDAAVQTVGIHLASTQWYHKIPEKTYRSHTRQRFVARIGRLFRSQLITDKNMSYPGHNGFSVKIEDLKNSPDIYEFLLTAVDYGDLFDAPHTTKTRDRKDRIKWYLNPIL